MAPLGFLGGLKRRIRVRPDAKTKGSSMSRFGDVYENKVTREYAVVLRGTDDRGDGPMTVHLTARPGAAVVGEHVHPSLRERFTVVSGRLEAKVAGTLHRLGPGQSTVIEPGVAHDWWNPSVSEDAHVFVELEDGPGAAEGNLGRFELMIATLFGLANDGKVDRKGRPSPLQAVVLAQEFADVIVFTRPPRAVQRVVVALLAPVARLLGYKATYAAYSKPHGHVAPDAEILAATVMTSAC
jgi:mannose-6-phosphate isomerase-like protein (cupin superfamily)